MNKIVKVFVMVCMMPVTLLSIDTGAVYAQSPGKSNAVWIDVRTQREWDAGHVGNAVLIPYNEIAGRISRVVRNKGTSIKLYCHSGRRAEIALRTLEKLGYRNVQNLGGYRDLKQQGY